MILGGILTSINFMHILFLLYQLYRFSTFTLEPNISRYLFARINTCTNERPNRENIGLKVYNNDLARHLLYLCTYLISLSSQMPRNGLISSIYGLKLKQNANVRMQVCSSVSKHYAQKKTEFEFIISFINSRIASAAVGL